MAAKILLVEDDDFLRDGLVQVFTQEGYAVTAAATLHRANDALNEKQFDAIVLDIGLPDGSGLALCARLRAQNNRIPILFLTAFDDEIQIVSGLDAGADDYVTKPFRLRELLSRVRALLRRTEQPSVIERGVVRIDLQNRTVTKDGEAIFLTPTEFQILSVLCRNAGVTVSREVLLRNIWDDAGNFIDDNTLSVHVSRLREKIGAQNIGTVRGVGYRFLTD